MRDLATPAGIDHDYNFISAIERGIERSDRQIVDEKKLVDRNELFRDHSEHYRYGRKALRQWAPPESSLAKALHRAQVIVDKAPKGMKRNVDNTTNWSRNEKCINWTVEWVREDGTKELTKVLETNGLGKSWGLVLEAEILKDMTPAERKADRKRKAEEHGIKNAKRVRVELDSSTTITTTSTMQNPDSSAWNLETDKSTAPPTQESNTFSPTADIDKRVSALYFYLHRPYTPAADPTVLIPLPRSSNLSQLLPNRVVQEFPTIYVLPSAPADLPDEYLLESHYLAGGKPEVPECPFEDPSSSEEGDGDDDDDDDDDDTSSEEESNDEDDEMEDGEI
jgi:hypothetical protein